MKKKKMPPIEEEKLIKDETSPLSKGEVKKDKKKKKKMGNSGDGKNNKNPEVEEKYIEINDESGDTPLKKGNRALKDLLAPSGFDRSNKEFIKVGDKYVRSFVVNAYPDVVEVGWLDSLYNSSDDLDVSFHIMPTDERSALDEINLEITKQEAQFQHEMKSGNIKNLGVIKTKIDQLYEQRAKLEQRQEKIYHSSIVANLHAKSLDELNKLTYKLKHTLGARKIGLLDLYMRHDDGYKSCLPIGDNLLEDQNRTINTGGIIASFPFYNGEISHRNGIFLGLNMMTGTPIYLDSFDRSVLDNGNMTIFGKSGSGKTFFVSLMTARSVLKKISTVIVDVEGEYKKLTRALGGRHIVLGPNSRTRINPFAIESEYDKEQRREIVNVKGKISDALNLIGVMVGNLDNSQRSIVSYVLKELYETDWGITEDPKSLYTNEEVYDKVTKEYIYAGTKKKMPTLSDFYKKLKKYAEENDLDSIREVVSSLTMFTAGNVYDFWDCQTSEDLEGLGNYPIITFDISQLESDAVILPIAMFVTLTWIWEGYVKKEQDKNKRIIVDECWKMMDPTMPGSEFTASFLNTAARRCRKRACALVVASQSFHEFIDNPKGLAVLMNASVNIFLRTEAMAIDSIQQTFQMSDGERNFLMSARKGQILIRMGEESCAGYVVPFDYEKELIENPFAYVKEDGYEEDDNDE